MASATLLAGGRAAQLAVRDASPRNAEAQEPTLASAEAPPAEEALTAEDLALLTLACPQAIDSLPPAWRRALTRTAPPHRLTAARQPEGEWLVDPGEWYAPEDQPPAEPPKRDEPPAEEPADPEVMPEPAPQAPDSPAATEPPPPPASEPAATESTAPEPAATDRDAAAPESTPAEPPAASPVAPPPVRPAAPPTEMVEPPAIEPPAIESPAEPLNEPPATEPKEDRGAEAPPSTPEPKPTPRQVTPTTPPAATPAEDLPLPSPSEGPVFPPQPAPRPPVQPPAEPVVPTPEPIQRPATPTRPFPSAPAPAPGDVPGRVPAPVARPAAPPAPAASGFGGPAAFPPPAMPSPHGAPARPLTAAEQRRADESHRELFAKNCYPSARDCAACHKQQYEEWSISSHAYAFVSPMFHKFEQTISKLSQGTVGYFCQRCHAPVATAMYESRDTPIWEMALVAREGVTCIACHRVNEQYSRTNGERRIVPGDIYAPVYGGVGGGGVAEAIANPSTYKVKTSPDQKGPGQAIHREGRFFEHLSQAEFCTTCHQVAVHPGIKLEVVWEQYRASPACKKGVTCQHCHMGIVPGIASPYEVTSIAEVGGKSVNRRRKHANHVFYGPGYSIAHPGVFPFHKDGERWRVDEWLKFDWRAGWGTDEFEDAVDDGLIDDFFPAPWEESDDRCDARQIIEDNIARLREKRGLRSQVMENGSKVAGPFFRDPPRCGEDLKFDYVVTNLNEGHNLPTASLGAQPQLWANVVLIGPDGHRVWETGYTDSNGDLADIHSEDVRNGVIPFDSQLFNLQTMFLITGATGTDREFPLPVNFSFDQAPHLRPGAVPITVLNHPPFIRMESRSIAPLGSKRVKYRVPGERLTRRGHYRLSFRMRSRVEPLYFMRFCNATTEMQRSMNEGILDIHPYSVEFEVK